MNPRDSANPHSSPHDVRIVGLVQLAQRVHDGAKAAVAESPSLHRGSGGIRLPLV